MSLRESFRFFSGMSGAVGLHAVSGIALARAESAYLAAEWDGDGNRFDAEAGPVIRFRWVPDEHFDPSDFSDPRDVAFATEHGAVGCILERWNPAPNRGWEHIGSLWGITESLNNRERDDYRRLVQAELAIEAGFGS